jgi:hypothetical protein
MEQCVMLAEKGDAGEFTVMLGGEFAGGGGCAFGYW